MRTKTLLTVLVAVAAVAGPAALASNDPGYKDQWGLQKVGAEQAWASSTGRGIVIAVVDTGVDLNHPDLKANLVGGRNFIEPGQPPQDDHGHGTHVAGIAAAVTNNGQGVAGTAPNAKIMPVRVLQKDGNGASGRLSDVDAGIRWAVDNGARIVNLSLSEETNIRFVAGSDMQNAINYAWSRGAIPVVSAGNDNFGILFPSGYGGVNALVVGATDRNDARASFSNDVDDAKWGMVAPGVQILSSWLGGQYATATGTSMSAPFVSGAAALLLAQGQTPQQTVDRLLSTAHKVGNRRTHGHGRLNAAAAVIQAPPPGAPPSAPASGPSVTPAPQRRGAEGRTPTGTGPAPSRAPAAESPEAEAPPAEPEVAATDTPGATTAPRAAAPPARESDRSRLTILLLAGLALAAAGGGLAYIRMRRP